MVHECDICIEHALVQRNTLLLRTYAAVDSRAKQLLLAIKIWAKRAGVADASSGTLSSYGWALLGIFYLQVRAEHPEYLSFASFRTLVLYIPL